MAAMYVREAGITIKTLSDIFYCRLCVWLFLESKHTR